jgi:hypothetical protein
VRVEEHRRDDAQQEAIHFGASSPVCSSIWKKFSRRIGA